jgi:hypothetical protein
MGGEKTMTIEIRELVIEARVTEDATPALHTEKQSGGLQDMSWLEQERLIDMIAKRVLEALRDQREM